ncbi:medium chain dehydrogenase/reductase family protein [Nonomuraea polychroma]|uniref:medium chain dehydrogenase/reductase family protein n=1 Tax=Nonomuraea polychroma TaxID=46176 RepID=UPI003D8E3C35
MFRRRVVVDRYGAPQLMQVVSDEPSAPGPGQVRLRVRFAGVAYADVLMRTGAYPGGPRPPFVPGWDVAGEVEELGPGVEPKWRGRRAVALVLRGGYASHLTVPVGDLVPVPDGVDLAQAACLPLAYVTAYHLLHRIAGARPGERLLIHGAAGGVGTAVLQLAGTFDVKCFGTASAGKHDVVAGLGAEPIDYRAEDFVARLRDPGVDVVLDAIGGGTLARSFRVLRPGGRLVSYGFSSLVREARAPTLPVLRQLALLCAWSSWPNGKQATFYRLSSIAKRRPAWVLKDLTVLVRLLAARELKPLIGAMLPLECAAEAHELVAGARVAGKVLLTPEEESS